MANLGQTNPWTLAVGLLTLAIILGMRRWAPRAPGVLVAVLAAIAATVLLDLAARGVATVGVLPQGFPRPSFPLVELADLPLLAATALGMSLVAIGDTISTSAGFAARQRLQVDANQELVGIGAANGLAGFFQGFPVSTSGSRTAVAEQSGAQTQLTGVVAAGAVLAMLLFVPGLVQNLPQAALAAIIIAAGSSLFDLADAAAPAGRPPRPSSALAVAVRRRGDPAGRAAGHRARGAPGDRPGLRPGLASLRRPCWACRRGRPASTTSPAIRRRGASTAC